MITNMNNQIRKDQRRVEAAARQAVADKRSLEERLKRLDEMGLEAKKERAKIALKMQERDKATQAQAEEQKSKGNPKGKKRKDKK